MLLDLHCWWSEELYNQQSSSSWCVSYVLEAVHLWLVTYWDPCIKNGGVHILKSTEVLKWLKVSTVSSSMGIIESRDKDFVLDLQLLFTVVNCFSGRFPPGFLLWNWLVSLVFLGHHILSYLFFRCMILTWYWCLFVLISFIHNKSN